jgi:BASS family bile acid:Na+ symporter
MRIIGVPISALSWLGRQGTKAVAALVVIGIFLPSVGAVLKPYLTWAVFALLCTAFLRVDLSAVRAYMRRPVVVIAGTAWTSIAIPVLFGLSCMAFDLEATSPDLFLSLMLQAVSSPMMAAPALASLMGLDATLVLVTLTAGTALVPFTAPFFTTLFVGHILSISPLTLGLKLFGILSGAALVGFGLRRLYGVAVIERHNDKINCFNIIVLFIFVAAIMENVGLRFLVTPGAAVMLTGLGFGIFFAVLFLTAVVFSPAGKNQALALAFMTSQRNLGLMLAATGGAVPELTWLYFALAQFPLYLAPFFLQPLVRVILERAPAHGLHTDTAE